MTTSLIDCTVSEAVEIWEQEKAKAPEKRGHTILIHVWIESPEDAGADTITPARLEFEIKSAIMRSNRIIDAIEIDKIEVEADLNYTEGAAF